VSHLSQDAARSRVERFSNFKNILDIIKLSINLDVKGMMISTHPLVEDILSYIKMEGLIQDLNLYPLIPYAQEYVRKSNQYGMLGLLNELLKPASLTRKVKLVFQGGIGYLQKDFIKLLGTLIDIELLPLKDYNISAIFLHNVFTDLALGLGAREIFEFYNDYIRDNYNAIPAYGTMNFARLLKKFNEWEIKNPLVMTSFNKVGFQMNPSKEECEQYLKNYDVDVLAMSTLAAGYLKPKEAYEYLFQLPNIKSVVVGVSTKEHAEETFGIIRSHQKATKTNG